MIILAPTPRELLEVKGLVPLDDIVKHLSQAIQATGKLQVNSSVTLTYSVVWDEDAQKLRVGYQAKSKRPVGRNRKEEQSEDSETLMTLELQEPGQQRIDGTEQK